MMEKSRKKLPAGWEMKTLGEVCETRAGGTPLKAHDEYYTNGTIPWLLSGEVSQGEIFESKNYITQKGIDNSSAKLLPPNTVLVAMYGATAGQVGILRFEACTNQAVCGILPNRRFIPEYIFYCFLSKKEELIKQAVGGAQPNISQIKIKNTKILIPPLPEQQRIVAKLDEAFAEIAAAKANIERNLQNCKEVFQSELNAVFVNKGKDLKEKKLGDIAFVKSGGTPSRSKKEFWEGNIPWYSSGELNELYTKNPERFINDLAIENSNAKLFPKGSLLIGMYDTAALKMSIIDRDATFNQAIAGVEPNENINLVYILHAINSKKEELLNQRRGVRQKNLSLEKIKNISILFPSIEVQKQIVNQLDGLSSRTKELEANYQLKLSSLEKLKKSILQKAFNGEL